MVSTVLRAKEGACCVAPQRVPGSECHESNSRQRASDASDASGKRTALFKTVPGKGGWGGLELD